MHQQLEGMGDLDTAVVIAGFGELEPWEIPVRVGRWNPAGPCQSRAILR
jgi:hypothetical protein